jgi:NAD-dependent SIR2 family protein deacetylase
MKKRMVVFSGAGLSAESGIWDYQLIEGLATVGMRQLEKQL